MMSLNIVRDSIIHTDWFSANAVIDRRKSSLMFDESVYMKFITTCSGGYSYLSRICEQYSVIINLTSQWKKVLNTMKWSV